MTKPQFIIDFCAFCGAQLPEGGIGVECPECGNDADERNCRCQGTFDAIDGERLIALMDGTMDEPTKRA